MCAEHAVRAHLGAAAARVRIFAPERAAAECGCRSTRLRACHDRRGQRGRRKRPHHRSSRRTRRAERLCAACRMLYGLAGR